ncbi:unnamed protein product [Aphanomyces euteiches]|nr:hypothetical protein AeRB84_019137 [Aphanomyces euteiches]
MSENEKLKNELEGQIQFGKALQTLMTNRPQLTMLPTLQSDQWRVQKLVTDPVLRRQAIEEILHQQYQLTEFSMIESGFEDGEESLTSFTPRLARSTADLVMCAAYSKLFDFSVDIVSEFAWMMYQGRFKARKDMSFEVFEKHGNDSIYMRVNKMWNEFAIQGNSLYKRFPGPDRVVIVAREDEVYPFSEGTLILNQSVWIVIEQLQHDQKCQMKYFYKCTPPMVQSHFGAEYMDEEIALSKFYRVGTVTESVLLTLKAFVGYFGKTLTAMLDNYEGNVVETFERVASSMRGH